MKVKPFKLLEPPIGRVFIDVCLTLEVAKISYVLCLKLVLNAPTQRRFKFN